MAILASQKWKEKQIICYIIYGYSCEHITFKCYAALAFNAYPRMMILMMVLPDALGEAQSSRHFATIKVWP